MGSCEKIRRYGPRALEGLKKIKALGVDRWAAGMQKKVNAGHCYLDEKT